MFSDNAGTDVGSDLIVLQKQTGKEISKGIEQQFVETVSVPKEEGSSVVFKHNSLFVGEWKDIFSSHRCHRAHNGYRPLWKTGMGVSVLRRD